MKIVLDCAVTAADPVKCSTNIQYLTFVNRTLETRPDVFFYWVVPDWFDDATLAEKYPQHPNVRYIRHPQHKDRTKEYLTLTKELSDTVAFNGPTWDYDAVLTMRSGMIPLLKMHATSPRTYRSNWTRQFWCLEAMVLMEFKPTVLCFDDPAQDYFTLTGYLAADRVYLTSHLDKPDIVSRARQLLPPSQAIKIAEKIVPVGYAQFSESCLKTPGQYPDPDNGKPFCLAHSGRMEKANRIAEINDVMTKTFVMKGDKVELLVCTVSSGPKVFDTSIVNVKTAGREEFWQLCREKMHVIIKMSDEGGSSLALLEPMLLGVPAIVGPRHKAGVQLGHDYPFLANNEVEAYALAKMFYDDYPAMYARYAEWHQTKFKALVEKRFGEDLVYNRLDADIEAFTEVHDRIRKEKPGKATNSLVLDILAQVGDREEFVLVDIVREMVAAKKCDKKILEKLEPGDRDRRGLVWSTDFNELRLALQVFHGWKDASTATGHFRRG